MKDGVFICMGTNEIHSPVSECPRKGMKTGTGYELCRDVCKQKYHAEVDACVQAGERAQGATLYLIGHSYCCDNCIKTMEEYGIENVVICDDNSDTDRLDKLQALTVGYGDGWVLRGSSTGRGMRLHESGHYCSVPDVRDAIDNYKA